MIAANCPRRPEISMSTVQATRLTADDLLAMSDERDYELVDGQLRERTMGMESSWVAVTIAHLLYSLAQDGGLGWVFGEGTGFQCFADDPNRVRKPDVAFLRRTQLPKGPPRRGFCRVAPDLAVEVVSPNDTAYEVETKLAEWLDAGVSEVWIVVPHVQKVRIHRADVSETVLGANDELTTPLVPGFRCRVAEFFPPMTDEGE
jgi:Uma2 family endonuclease